ncbi:MEMO1 protein [Salpingoeca rosetta]|uniref:MEMO1 protein n=1 Tax=Salpingoeca rosetta (strain ATCC 50818 / BSB-021) TaxID=946362 RepID=F2U8K5_SALR5|nr:MEMO1 protein [Salpingoeca rosetta]EGD72713.1 MEMO1 protein [Salpingoeca rosetta]|eukprot:XP_004994536.1 MEMO1 protein [Salpingoeca rosetta]
MSAHRRATHAGSWYTDDGKELSGQLDAWLGKVGEAIMPGARAIIAPHAGYSYSGPTAAYAYKQIVPDNVRRVFVLGPSHHVYIQGCALTSTTTYDTPIGNLKIDRDTNKDLEATGQFEHMDIQTDEDEHSIEMHLPYVAKVMEGKDFTVVPVLVGALDSKLEQEYGKIFAPYLEDPSNLFVISSDFCHWGRRFGYTYVPPGHDAIYKGIEHLDKQGMDIIEKQDAKGFRAYLQECENTICGRNPISILLNALQVLKDRQKEVKFLHYAQSNPCKSTRDSSVSYASAAVLIS